MTLDLKADLVCEGGGVKGIGLVGAVHELAAAGYTFPRVAGTSSGAIVSCLIAALQKAGEPISRLDDIAATIDYSKFEDSSWLGRIPLVGGALSILSADGIYEGDYLEKFIAGTLKDLGVETFGDLRTGDSLPAHAWSLVVTASDLSRRRLVRIPWDLPAYDTDPDEFSVAKAVRASAAIPYFFQPVRVAGATWVDGGLLSDFPVGLFDREASKSPRWPTFGIRLTAKPGIPPATRAVRGPISIGIAAIDTLFTGQDAAYTDDVCTVKRTVFVPTDEVSAVDFSIDRKRTGLLYANGAKAAKVFLAGWDFEDYKMNCRSPA
ncbi:MAG: patatin-like phospholipase family protein [Kineosporiaceae bacterium]|nr:patatin-like phospholipase family protein [Aeromicrobium sp.]